MTDSDTVERLARYLYQAWRDGERLPLPDVRLESEQQAYAVQQQVAAALGWFQDGAPRAWKLGGMPPDTRSAAGVAEPAIIPSPFIAPRGFANAYGIEAELAIRLACDVPAGASLAQVREAIGQWIACIELCDTRLHDLDQAPALLRLADQQLNRALILGDEIVGNGVRDWATQAVSVHVDDRVIIASTGSHPFIDPLASLPWLACHAYGLRAGDIIATGSWTGLFWAPSGARVDIHFPGIGGATVIVPT